MESDIIASMEYPGSIPLFAYLSCFSKEVWLLIIASIAVLSLISSIDRKTFDFSSIIFDIFSNFMVLLISKSMQKSITNRISAIILSIWLLSALVLSIQFSTFIMEFMVTAVPMVRIDSFEDLVKHKDMKIVVLEDHSFTSYVRQNDTELKRSLSSMLDPYENDINPWLKKLAKGFKDLSYAYITNKELMIFILIDVSLNYIKEPPNIFEYLTNQKSQAHMSHISHTYEPWLICVFQ